MAKLYDLVPYGDKSLVPIWNSLTEQKKKKKKETFFQKLKEHYLYVVGT